MLNTLLYRLVEWKGKQRAAQVIVFDGGAEVERTRAFLRGALTGIALAFGALALAAPSVVHPALVEEVERREVLLHEANDRADQAAEIAGLCLNTAENMERTLKSYQRFLGNP